MNSLLAAHCNTSRVLRQLWLQAGISRAEIADRLGRNRSTLMHIIKDLAERGIVSTLESSPPGPQGGRKSVGLAVNRSFGCFAGFDLFVAYGAAAIFLVRAFNPSEEMISTTRLAGIGLLSP